MWTADVLWVLAGVVLLLAELASPGFVLFFFAIGAFAAALLAGLTDLGPGTQIVCFVVVSLAGVALLRRMFLRVFRGRTKAAGPAEDDVAVGRIAVVSRAIAPGAPGEIKFRGSFWRALADETLAKGENVIILGPAGGDADAYRVRRSGPETRSGER